MLCQTLSFFVVENEGIFLRKSAVIFQRVFST